MDFRNVLIAIVLSTLVLVVWATVFEAPIVEQQTTKNEIPYHLNPLVYDIHKLNLENKNPPSWEDIKIYIHSLPPKKLLFALNYL